MLIKSIVIGSLAGLGTAFLISCIIDLIFVKTKKVYYTKSMQLSHFGRISLSIWLFLIAYVLSRVQIV